MLLLSRDGQRVPITRAAASLSGDSRICDRQSPDELPLGGFEAGTLRDLVAVAELVAARVTPRANGTDAAWQTLLRRMPPPRQLGVLRAASLLSFTSVARLASLQVASLLRGRSSDVQRVVLEAPDDLSAAEKEAAASEPLLAPPGNDDLSDHDLSGHHLGHAHGNIDGNEQWMAACIADLDAKSLRSLKSVSRTWRARARRLLGDASSPWRTQPGGGEWSAGDWAVSTVSRLDHSPWARPSLGRWAVEWSGQPPTLTLTLRPRPSPSPFTLTLRPHP